jgi:glutaminase
LFHEDLALIENMINEEHFTVAHFSEFKKVINEIYLKCKQNEGGQLSQQLPELAKKDPNQFGVSICTIDGQRANFGDAHKKFSVRGCTYPINYCQALEQHGSEVVHRYVGYEPSGL